MLKLCITGLLVLLLAASCEELVPNDLARTNQEVFNELWTYADQNYAMLEEKNMVL